MSRKFLQDLVAVLGGDRFRVELHAVDRMPRVHRAHDHAVVAVGRDLEDSGMLSGAMVSE